MKVFALVDCNNFYVSCERVFNPGLKNRPVVVLSNNDGCIISRSNESKILGISMGVPYFKIRNFCAQQKVRVYSSNYTLYGDLSRRVMDVIKYHVEDVEEYSIDEAFLRFDIFNNKEEYMEMGQELREKILQWVGIPVSIGFAPTKVLAKVANKVAKQQTQSNVFSILDRQHRKSILSSFPVFEVWGIGSRWAKKLNQMGIVTAWELCQVPETVIRRNFNVLMERIILELKGVACSDLEAFTPRKEIVCSRAFSKKTNNIDDLKQAVSCYVVRACEKLRLQHGVANAVKVFISSNSFKENKYYSNAATCYFNVPSQDTLRIVKTALAALQKIFLPDVQYKKVGVMLLDIHSSRFVQHDLFAEEVEIEERKSEQLMKTIDCVNQKMGKNTLWLGSQGVERSWKMRPSYVSPCYTTQWGQLLKVK